MRVAVVGHVEWVEFLRVDHVPVAGEIVEAAPLFAVPAGGGGVAAVGMARWCGSCVMFTALGDDELGHRAADGLRARGVELHVAWRKQPQRRAITLLDAHRERTITTIGERLVAHGDDPLPWSELATCDAVYVTGGDPAALRHARQAKVAVATARILPFLQQAGIAWDALVSSANDAAERYTPGQLSPEPHLVVRTDGSRGGTYVIDGGAEHHYAARKVDVTGDTYGAGDTFAAALTCGLGSQLGAAAAIGVAAARAAEVLSFTGPYPGDGFHLR